MDKYKVDPGQYPKTKKGHQVKTKGIESSVNFS